MTPPSGTLYDSTAQQPFRQVAYTRGGAQPRLAVALDYMHISRVEMVLHWEQGKGNALLMVVGPKTHKLSCIASIRLWGYSGRSGSWIDFDTKIKLIRQETGTAWGKPIAALGSGVYEMAMPSEQGNEMVRLQKEKSTRWFCEVKLQAPAGFPADHFKLDPWFFPVDFTRRETGVGPILTLRRRLGEHGEVPDWDWLNETNSDRYPAKKDIIGVFS